MFAESMLESGNIHREGRGWSTLLSIALQSLLLAALVALPMFRPDALPMALKITSSPIAFGRADVLPPTPQSPTQRPVTPREEPRIVFTTSQDPAVVFNRPTEINPPGPYMPGPISRPDGVRNVLESLIPANPPTIAVKPPERVIVSRIDPGRLTYQVKPIYPLPAKLARVEGTVVLHAVIDREGRITSLQVTSGPPLLQAAARDAVRQWRYQPYILNGVAVEVETQVSVIFRMAR